MVGPRAARMRRREGAVRAVPAAPRQRAIAPAPLWPLGGVPAFLTGAPPTVIQRTPLSDSVKDAWTADPTLETLLARLSRGDVQADQGDTDVDGEIARLLAGRPADLWVAQRIRAGEFGKTTGRFGPKVKGKAVPRPVKAFFVRGSSDRRALVIAGVHGSERQGMQVAEMLLADLAAQPAPPFFTTIVVPTLFPDSKARGDEIAALGKKGVGRMDEARESGPDMGKSIPTNRNFPDPSKDLAGATNKKGVPVDKIGRAILPENQMLMQLMERFRPERIISVHGTKGPGSAGVFYDPRALRADERKAAGEWAVRQGRTVRSPSWESEGGPEARQRAVQDALYRQRVDELAAQAVQDDLDLSLKAAAQIDKATEKIAGRDTRRFSREGESPATVKANRPLREKHPSVAGNVGPTGALDFASWSGGAPGGVSLGGYAPPRGMSVFTVEPPLNYRSDDPHRLDALTAAERKLELQAYADAIRTVLLGAP